MSKFYALLLGCLCAGCTVQQVQVIEHCVHSNGTEVKKVTELSNIVPVVKPQVVQIKK
jgi:hypothetical protein